MESSKECITDTLGGVGLAPQELYRRDAKKSCMVIPIEGWYFVAVKRVCRKGVMRALKRLVASHRTTVMMIQTRVNYLVLT